jgi:Flp pilus assembly pilin Flp
MSELVVYLRNWLQHQKGQDLIEYALLIGLIALLLIVAITAGGQAISTVWSVIASTLQSVAT